MLEEKYTALKDRIKKLLLSRKKKSLVINSAVFAKHNTWRQHEQYWNIDNHRDFLYLHLVSERPWNSYANDDEFYSNNVTSEEDSPFS